MSQHHSYESVADRHRFHVLAGASVALALTSMVLLVYLHSWERLGRVMLLACSAQVAGKWLIFVGAKTVNPTELGPWGIAYVIFLLDLLLALVFNSFLPHLEGLPYLGPWLVKTREKTSAAYAGYPKLKNMAWSGIALWVFLPLPASGPVTASFASRLVGLSRTSAVTAIAVGSAGTAVLFAAMAQALGAKSQELIDNWKVTAASAVILVLLLWWGWRRLVKHLRTEV